ncbi:MAG: hypothetical protein LBC55_01270 [Desulfovibrio sp.]|jgi:hypothetical protein|nr:hypothetical protein [Desulfovibrio sp.]
MATENTTPWICIARTGTFHDSEGRPHTFTEADLERISKGYDPAKSAAPLVFGHPKHSDPAYGWVVALKREGEKLFAQCAHVPAAVKKLVQDRRYRYVSMSLSPDKTRLLHVGLLGAAAPAIDGLPPVSLTAEAVTINFSGPEGGQMNPEELQKQIGAQLEQIKTLRADNDKLRAELAEGNKNFAAAEAAHTKIAADFAAYKRDLAAEKRKARVRALVDAGKLEPAKEAETLAFAAALGEATQTVNFAAADGKTEQITTEERYFRELESRAPDPRFSVNFAAPLPGHASPQPGPAIPADINMKL